MGVLALDDRDATIAYSTGWSQAGSSNEFNSTTTFTSTVGARAQVTFFGSQITVFGTISASLTNRPTSSYVLDSESPVNFQGTPTLTTQFNRVFYQSPILPVASHTLTITNTGEDAPLFLDVFFVAPPDGPITTTVTTTMTPPAVTTARTVTVTSLAQASATAPQADRSNSGTGAASTGGSNGGAIAGGIIGALALILFLAAGIIFYRRRRQRQNTDSEPYWIPKVQTGGMSSAPSPPFAPQFQTSTGGPEMNQASNPGYSSYEPWQSGYPSQTQAAPYPTTTAGRPYAPATPPGGSDLAYYSANDTSAAYDGYVQDPSPYPPLPPQAGPGTQQGRVRVNLND